MSAESRDQASSNLDELETYVRRLEQEWKSTEGVLEQLKHKFDQSDEDNSEAHEQISNECRYLMNGGAC